VSGGDSIRQGQTLTVVYADGKTRSSGVTCNGTATIPECVLGTVTTDATGNWLFDRIVSASTAQDPTSTTYWQRVPTSIKVFSSAPNLGGAGTATIVKK
jgi:hypothetical protein